MTPYQNLKRRWERDKYRRGQFAGDAPLEKRAATHKRILTPSESRVQVLMHHTIIMTAYADGRFVLNTDGWHDSPTTRETVGSALHAAGLSGYLTSKRIGNYSQTAIGISGVGTWRFEDGMEFSHNGELLSPAPKWQKYVADREARKAKVAELKPLLDVLPILHSAQYLNGHTPGRSVDISKFNPDEPELWPGIVRHYSLVWDRDTCVFVVDPDWRKVRSRIVSAATRKLVTLVEVDDA